MAARGTRALARLETRPASAAEKGRWADCLIALAGLALLALPLACVCLAIRLDSAGPAFFLQTRIGRQGRPFRIVKLRTMSQAGGTLRVTRLGAWIRRLGIDEVPQLVNVVLGDMALIGPRPLIAEDCHAYLSAGSSRVDVLPGITGLAQATGRHLSPAHRDRLDRFYVRHRSPALDMVVLWRTLRVTLTADRPPAAGNGPRAYS